jgi:hypothetical protein
MTVALATPPADTISEPRAVVDRLVPAEETNSPAPALTRLPVVTPPEETARKPVATVAPAACPAT